MKKGEYYRHKWNKYVSKITNIRGDIVELKTVNSSVTETIDRLHFDNNYEPCTIIYQWRKTIESAFTDWEMHLMGDCVRVNHDTTIIDFSISDNMFVVCFTDDIKDIIESDTNILRYTLDEADEIIELFASLV